MLSLTIRPSLPRIVAVVATTVALAACGSSDIGDRGGLVESAAVSAPRADDQPGAAAAPLGADAPVAVIEVLSSLPQQVSGGDARIRLRAPHALHDRIELWLNGAPIAPRWTAGGDDLEGMIGGLIDGENLLEARLAGAGPIAAIRLNNHPITGPIFSGPHQHPFVCTSPTEYGRQPLVDSLSPPGFPVRDEAGRTIGYSRNCTIAAFVTYWYRSTEDRWKPLPQDGSRPLDLATTVTLDGRTVDFIVRQERGTINRFLFSFAMLAPQGEDPSQPDLSLWNRRLVYFFQGGVGIGHSQGRYQDRAMEPAILGRGYALAFSSGNSTSTHNNLPLAGETAIMTKEGFIERYGLPLHTIGLGGSGGAIQQYYLAQNQPGVLDAALPVQSYPDMITQTIHVGDCELLEHYMDVTDRGNSKWRSTRKRSWLVGFNADDSFPDLYDQLAPVKVALGYSTSLGMTECSKSWRGLTPLVLNPHFGRAPNQELMEPAGLMESVKWTHYDDLRNVYGVDARGDPRTTWDNIGVQYGLQSLKQGLISPAEFLDLNAQVGGWKHPRDMVQEGLPLIGIAQGKSVSDMVLEALSHRSRFDPWSRRNMQLSPAPGIPAPRTRADPIATRAAYASGMVFTGVLPIPTIDNRQYLERELDMHNARQSFVVRQRVLQQMGHSEHLVIWFADTRPGYPRFEPWYDALAVMDEWLANMRQNPQLSIGQNRPARAIDSCFDIHGQLQHAGADAWHGILDALPAGPCTVAYPIYGTSRTVAGAPFDGSVFQCALKPVQTALIDGTYAPWMPNANDSARLTQIFPDGVCDYGKADQARP